MKAAVLHGRCQCSDQCGGGSSGEHVHNLDEFMRKLSRMLANPDRYDAQYSPDVWNKVWLEPNGFVVLGKFWDDFYVTEEVVDYLSPHQAVSPPLVQEGRNMEIDAHTILHQFQQLYPQSYG
jgi:hypothetical protein